MKKETIKIGYDKETSLYTMKAPASYSINNLEVNGVSILDPLQGYSSGSLIVTSIKPETITYKKTSNKHIGYDNIEDHSTISPKEYNETIVSFNREYDDDNEEYVYVDLETEIKATRFIRNHKRIYENTEEIIHFEIEMIEYPASSFPEIVPLYSMDAKHVFETKCKYTPNLMKVLENSLSKYGVSLSDLKIPTHSGIRYVQINGKYITDIEAYQRRFDRTHIGMYNECTEFFERTISDMDAIIQLHFAKESKKILDKETVGSIVTSLVSLSNSVAGLDVKQKDTSSQRAIQQRMNELVKVYKELA